MLETDSSSRPDDAPVGTAGARWPLVRLAADGSVRALGDLWPALTGSGQTSDWWSFVHVHDRQRLLDLLATARATREPACTQARLRRADSVYRPVTLEFAPADPAQADGDWWLSSPDPMTLPKPVQAAPPPAPRITVTRVGGRAPTGASAGVGDPDPRAAEAETGPPAALPAGHLALFQRLARQRALDRRHGRLSAFVDLGPIQWTAADAAGGEPLVRQLARLLRRSDLIVALTGGPTVIMITDLGTTLDEAAANAADITLKIVRWLRERLPGAGPLAGAIGLLGDGADWAAQLAEAERARSRACRIREEVVFIDPRLQRSALERARLVDDLRQALEARAFVLQFQPVIGRGARLAAIEALLRWHRRGMRGLQFPAQFLAVAERAGLMQRLGRWVLESVCAGHAQWQQRLGQELSIAVNVGAAEFHAPGFVDHACEALARHGLASGAIVLELPAQVLSDPDQRTLGALGRLRSAGFGVHFDGYGEKGVDLMGLRDLPVDAIKLDTRSLVDRPGARVGGAITEAIVRVAHSLGLEVHAKSIETPAQYDLFRDTGCDAFQGRLLGEPSASARALVQAVQAAA